MDDANQARSDAAKDRPREVTDTGKTIFQSQVPDQLDPGLDSDRDHKAEEDHRTSTAIAKDLGVAPAAVKRATTIINKAPEFAEKIMAGEMKAGSAMKEIKKNIANIKRQDRVDRITEISAGNVEMGTSEQFPVIYADPPWQYDYSKAESRDIAAKKAGFSNHESYRQATAIVERGAPELVDAVDNGDVSISAAYTLLVLPVEEQADIVAQGYAVATRAAAGIRKDSKTVLATLHTGYTPRRDPGSLPARHLGHPATLAICKRYSLAEPG